MGILKALADSSFIPRRWGWGGAYKGASRTDAAGAAWNPPAMSANAALLPELERLTSRSADSDRNNGIARAGIETNVDNVVGMGLTLSARPDWKALGKDAEWAEQISQEIEREWCAWWWSTDCHAGGMLTGDQLSTQAYRTQAQKGEAVGLPLWLPDRSRKFATRLMLIDPSRLSQPTLKQETFDFHGGIEFDPFGGATAYHFLKNNPGDRYAAGFMSNTWERVPRMGPNGRLRVLHMFQQRYPGQSRGEPMFTPVLMQLKQLDRYIDAELMAAVVNACVAAVVTTPMTDDIANFFQANPASYLEQRAAHGVNIKPGTVSQLFPGDTLESFMPNRPATGFAMFVENMLRTIAVGIGMPYELLYKDFSKANYSSMRAAMLEAWRSFQRQRDTFATQFMDPIYALWLEEAAAANIIALPNFYANRQAYLRCRWIGAGRGWVDPVREAQAAQIRMEIGVSTLEDECAEQGKPWRAVLEQRAIEKAYAAELGVSLAAPAAPGVDPNFDPNASDPNAPNAPPGDNAPAKDLKQAGYAA